MNAKWGKNKLIAVFLNLENIVCFAPDADTMCNSNEQINTSHILGQVQQPCPLP